MNIAHDTTQEDIFEWVLQVPKNDRPVLDEIGALHAIEAYLRLLPSKVEMVSPAVVRKAIFRDAFVHVEDWENALARFTWITGSDTEWQLAPIPTPSGREFIRSAYLSVIQKAFERIRDRSNAATAHSA